MVLVAGSDSVLFSARIHYGGELKLRPKIQYVGGLIVCVDYCHPDRWSLIVLEGILLNFGITEPKLGCFYCIPGISMDNNLVHIVSDDVAYEMAALGSKYKLMDIYIVHEQKCNATELYADATIWKSTQKSTSIDLQRLSSPPRGSRIKMTARKRVKPHLQKLCSPSRGSRIKMTAKKRVKPPGMSTFSEPSGSNDDDADEALSGSNDDDADEAPIGSKDDDAETVASKGGLNKPTHESEENDDQHSSPTVDGQAGQASRSNGEGQTSQKQGKGKEKIVDDDNLRDDTDFNDLEDLLDSDYELEEECGLENVFTDRDSEWERITAMFKNQNASEKETATNRKHDDEDVEFSDLESHESSSNEEDETVPCRPKRVRFNPEIDMHDPKFMLGMVFSNKAEFKLACKHHGVKEGRRIRFKKVDKRRVTVICMDCDWMISTAHLDGDESLHITSLRAKHTCGTTFNHGCASASFLSKKYVKDICVMPQMKISEFVQKVYADLKLNISRTKASLAKKMATVEIEGDYTMQYAKLPDYYHELKRANPGSNVILKTVENDYGDEIF